MEGIVTGVEELNKTKCRVSIDGEVSFLLYKSECRKYGIEEGTEISLRLGEELLMILKKRAVSYAVHLLEASDRTEGQIRDKLRDKYPGEVVDYVITKLAGYRYIDDKNYAERFVERNCNSMSIREMENKLYEKKVPGEVIKEVVANHKMSLDNADEEAFLKLFNKKCINIELLDIKEKRRITAFFLRKGFSYELIRRYIEVNDEFL